MSEPLHRIVLIEHYIDVKNSLEIQPYGWIYKIEFPNGKVYIGQTTCLEDRKTTHISSANNDNKRFLVYKALRKYNMIETFELVVIDTADNKEELSEKEIAYIHFYNSHHVKGYGYNMTFGGEGTNGFVRTEEYRAVASVNQSKYFKNNPDKMNVHVEKMNKRRIENPVEWGKEHSEKMIKHYDPNTKSGMDAREKASKKTIEQFERPEQREKASEGQKRRFEKPGEKERASESQKIRYAKPESIEKISEAAKKRHAQPGAKEKLLVQRGKNKPIDVYKKDGTFIGTFTYQFQIHDYLKETYNEEKVDIYAVLKGKQSTSKGFKFKYI